MEYNVEVFCSILQATVYRLVISKVIGVKESILSLNPLIFFCLLLVSSEYTRSNWWLKGLVIGKLEPNM